ncbi:MAG: glycosyltransferase family 2 protein [Gemmobacter sp.]
MRICVITLMKNEGPFILEWLAHWRSLGVTDVIVFSNDCFDGTDLILDRLDAMGLVQHLPNPAGLVGSSQFHRMALAYGADLRRHREADYTMICDVDEFLHIGVVDGTLPGLLALHGHPDAISFSEVLFGFSGCERFEDRPVTERFTWATTRSPDGKRARRGVKTIAKVGPDVLEWSNHRPQLQDRRGIRWLDGSGKAVPRAFRLGTERGMDVRGCMDQAWLAHYSVRSAESMLLKLDRGDAVRQGRLQPDYARKRSSADEVNTTMQDHAAIIRMGIEVLAADPVLRRLHDAAVAAHRQRIDALKADPVMRDAWTTIRGLCLSESVQPARRQDAPEAPETVTD